MAASLTAFIPRLLLTAVVILLFIASWIFLPPPDRRLFPLAVGAPELFVWLLLSGVAIGVAAAATSRRGAIRSTTIGLAVAATLMAAVPLVRMPFAIRRFDDRMRAALGPNALETRAGMRPAPVVLSELLSRAAFAARSQGRIQSIAAQRRYDTESSGNKAFGRSVADGRCGAFGRSARSWFRRRVCGA